ncbi:MAG TPA: hypothetical protein VGO93_25260 [Candidatus Xenobia bacterium]|jgi:hypothetical protein
MPRRLALVTLLVLSGASESTFMVVWNRQGALQLGSPLSSVAIVAATVVAGLGLGAWLAGRYLPGSPTVYVVLASLLGAAATLVMPHVAARPALIALTVVVPSAFLGAALGVLTDVLPAALLLGGAAGAWLADHLLIERLGLLHTGFLATAVTLAAGALAAPVTAAEARQRGLPSVLAAGGFCGVACAFVGNRLLIVRNDPFAFSTALGVVLLGLALVDVLGKRLRPLDAILGPGLGLIGLGVLFAPVDGSATLYRHWDDTSQTEVDDLVVNGRTLMSNTPAAIRYSTLLSAGPALLHPDPRDVLVVGAGLALPGAVHMTSTHEVDWAEPSRAVVALDFRLDPIGAALQSPKLRIIPDNGRHYLLTTDRHYDVITSTENLFSREYFEVCRTHLKPGGLMTQWLPVDQMAAAETRSVMRAFQDVFPSCYLWEGAGFNLCLVGTDTPLIVDGAVLADRVRQNAGVLHPVGLDDAEQFLAWCLKGPGDLAAYVKDAPPLIDDRSHIEYSRAVQPPDVLWLFAVAGQDLPAVKNGTPADLAGARFRNFALHLLEFGHASDPQMDPAARLGMALQVLDGDPANPWFAHETQSDGAWEKFWQRQAPAPPALLELGRIAICQGRHGEAERNLDAAARTLTGDRRIVCHAYQAFLKEREGHDATADWHRLQADPEASEALRHWIDEHTRS